MARATYIFRDSVSVKARMIRIRVNPNLRVGVGFLKLVLYVIQKREGYARTLVITHGHIEHTALTHQMVADVGVVSLKTGQV